MNTYFLVVGLGYGDEGKGRIVAELTRALASDLTVRYNGGPQAGHNVVMPDGRHHTFSQFGCGTFSGARTFLSKHVMIAPGDAIVEAEVLRIKSGFAGALSRTWVDERARVITPYHVLVNRFTEQQRGVGRHGSCGKGVGAAVEFYMHHPELTIRAGDLRDRRACHDKLWNIRNAYSKAIPTHVLDDVLLDLTLKHYEEYANCVHIITPEQSSVLLHSAACPIFEGAQGVLLDEQYGFAPYNTWSNTTLGNAYQILREFSISQEIKTLGVIRPYATRHGPGPFPTGNDGLTYLFPDQHNGWNQWQRNFRVGWFDVPAIRYGLRCLGTQLDGLALTHEDELHNVRPAWSICHEYHTANGARYTPCMGDPQIADDLFRVIPAYDYVETHRVVGYIQEHLELPIRITTNGPVTGRSSIINTL